MRTHSRKIPYVVIFCLFLLLYIIPLGLRPLTRPDEVRYGQVPREMIQSGDWVVPHLNGLRYFEKPVLGYWLHAFSIQVFGENAFAIRFPSAIASGLSALLIFFLVRRFVGGYAVQVLVLPIFLTCLEVVVIGTFGVLDSVVSLFVTAAMTCFFCAYSAERRSLTERGYLLGLGIVCGLAFLTKGFLAFVVPFVSIVPFMLWERRWKDLFSMAWLPMFAAILVALPWSILIHLREPDFWNVFFWNGHVRRFLAHNAQHKQSFWFFFYLLPAMAIPWTFLVPAALGEIQKHYKTNALIRYAFCWFLFPFLFFSLSKGKLITYILPCFPPFAILAAIGLNHYRQTGKHKAFDIGALTLGAFMAICALGILIVQALGVSGVSGFTLYSQNWKALLGAMGFGSVALFAVFAARQTDYPKKLALYAGTPLLLLLLAPLCIPDIVLEEAALGGFLLSHSDRIRPDTMIFADARPLHAVCWFYNRNDVYLFETKGELEFAFDYDDSQHRFMNREQFRTFVTNPSRTGKVVLIAIKKKYDEDWQANLPQPVFETSNGENGFVFVEY